MRTLPYRVSAVAKKISEKHSREPRTVALFTTEVDALDWAQQLAVRMRHRTGYVCWYIVRGKADKVLHTCRIMS